MTTELLDALDAVAVIIEGCGEFGYVSAVTPRSLPTSPAWFPDAVESMTRQTQDGKRLATVPYWVAVSSSHTDHQRELYRLADLAWTLLEDDEGGTVAQVVEMRQVGSLTIGEDELWGAQLVVELWV